MKRAGKVVRVAQGLAIVRAENDEFPEIGTAVVDEQLDEIGRIVDVFGPVERPYLAVTPEDRSLPQLVGSVLYAR